MACTIYSNNIRAKKNNFKIVFSIFSKNTSTRDAFVNQVAPLITKYLEEAVLAGGNFTFIIYFIFKNKSINIVKKNRIEIRFSK